MKLTWPMMKKKKKKKEKRKKTKMIMVEIYNQIGSLLKNRQYALSKT